MLKILVITPGFPPMVGGIARLMLDTCLCLPGESLTVLASSGDDYSQHIEYNAPSPEDVAVFDAAQPYRIEREIYSQKTKWRTLLSVLRFWRRAKEIVTRDGISLVYCGVFYPTGLVGLALRLTRGVPYIVQTHGTELLKPRNWGERHLAHAVLRNASRVVANSRWGRDTLAGMGVDPARITVIHPKVDTQRFLEPPDLAAFKEREGLSGKRVLLTVARLSIRKGQHLVIRALPKIVEKYPDLIYIIVGTGPDQEFLMNEARSYGVESHVRFVGNRDIVAFYHACDIFVMPSLYITHPTPDVESFGITFLEASACGKPVIGADNGGMPDAVANGKSGILVKTGDVEELQAAILRLMDDPALAHKLGRQGYERVCGEFNIERNAIELRELTSDPYGDQRQHQH